MIVITFDDDLNLNTGVPKTAKQAAQDYDVIARADVVVDVDTNWRCVSSKKPFR